MAFLLRDVRSQGQSRKHVLALSFSGFERSETSNLIASEAGWVPFLTRGPFAKCQALGTGRDVFLGDTCNGASSSRFLVAWRRRGRLRRPHSSQSCLLLALPPGTLRRASK